MISVIAGEVTVSASLFICPSAMEIDLRIGTKRTNFLINLVKIGLEAFRLAGETADLLNSDDIPLIRKNGIADIALIKTLAMTLVIIVGGVCFEILCV